MSAVPPEYRNNPAYMSAVPLEYRTDPAWVGEDAYRKGWPAPMTVGTTGRPPGREDALCQHFPKRESWGEGVSCLCARQFSSMERWAAHALQKVDAYDAQS